MYKKNISSTNFKIIKLYSTVGDNTYKSKNSKQKMSNPTKEIYARLFTQSPTTQNLRAALLLQHPLEKQPKDILKTQSLIQFNNIRGKKNIKDASAV